MTAKLQSTVRKTSEDNKTYKNDFSSIVTVRWCCNRMHNFALLNLFNIGICIIDNKQDLILSMLFRQEEFKFRKNILCILTQQSAHNSLCVQDVLKDKGGKIFLSKTTNLIQLDSLLKEVCINYYLDRLFTFDGLFFLSHKIRYILYKQLSMKAKLQSTIRQISEDFEFICIEAKTF